MKNAFIVWDHFSSPGAIAVETREGVAQQMMRIAKEAGLVFSVHSKDDMAKFLEGWWPVEDVRSGFLTIYMRRDADHPSSYIKYVTIYPGSIA